MTATSTPHTLGTPARLLLAVIVAAGLVIGATTTASATTGSAAENVVGASTSASVAVIRFVDLGAVGVCSFGHGTIANWNSAKECFKTNDSGGFLLGRIGPSDFEDAQASYWIGYFDNPVLLIGQGSGGAGVAAGVQGAGKFVDDAVIVGANSIDDWPKMVGILRNTGRGKGNVGLGSATQSQAQVAGSAWVGPGFRFASDGKKFLSASGFRQWRPPTYKPQLGKWQSNFESRWVAGGKWQANGHPDITGVG